jgi:chromate reductase, NAD(P)H dehydrogenase (quinone)
MTTYKIGYLVGSLAIGSINRKLARALVQLAPKSLEFNEISFRELPLYSYDYDTDFPPAAKAFKATIAAADAVLFVTPEYNRSIPGGLKNAKRLGQPPLRQQFLCAQALGGDRNLARRDRDGRRTAEPA